MMAMWLGRLLSALLLGLCLLGGPALAQAPAEPTPEQVKSLLHLLADPVVKGWIERETAGKPAAPPAQSTLAAEEAGIAAYVEGQMLAARNHVGGLRRRRAGPARRLVRGRGPDAPGGMSAGSRARIALLLAVFASLGLLVEWLVGRATAGQADARRPGRGRDRPARA